MVSVLVYVPPGAMPPGTGQVNSLPKTPKLLTDCAVQSVPAPAIPPPWAGSGQGPRLTFLLVIGHYQGRPGVSRPTAATWQLLRKLAICRDVSRFASYGATFALTEPSCPET